MWGGRSPLDRDFRFGTRLSGEEAFPRASVNADQRFVDQGTDSQDVALCVWVSYLGSKLVSSACALCRLSRARQSRRYS